MLLTTELPHACLYPSDPVWVPSLWRNVAHIQGRSFHFSSSFLGPLSWAHPKVCLIHGSSLLNPTRLAIKISYCNDASVIFNIQNVPFP